MDRPGGGGGRAARGGTSRARQGSPCPPEARWQAGLVVVSELRRVELPAGNTANLGVDCPPVTVAVRAVQLVCGPSAAQGEEKTPVATDLACVRVARRRPRGPGRRGRRPSSCRTAGSR